jgi:hypothetical protein
MGQNVHVQSFHDDYFLLSVGAVPLPFWFLVHGVFDEVMLVPMEPVVAMVVLVVEIPMEFLIRQH